MHGFGVFGVPADAPIEGRSALSIGQVLTEAREAAGLSVVEVAAATRIRRTLVEAIERDDFAPCGGDFYARGHVRSIAGAIGIDPAPLLAEFDASRTPAPSPRPTDVYESAKAFRTQRTGPNWSAAMAAALVLVVIYGVAQLITQSTGGSHPDPVAGSHRPGGHRTQTSQPSSGSTASPTPSVVAEANKKVQVTVAASDRSWLQVTNAAGHSLYTGLMVGGDVRTFSDRSRVKLVIGNAGALSLTVNGTKVGAPGKSGQVVHLEFGPQDPAAG